jgi:hypothetical protein
MGSLQQWVFGSAKPRLGSERVSTELPSAPQASPYCAFTFARPRGIMNPPFKENLATLFVP